MEACSLARIQKLQELVWEQGGALSPGTYLRLEVTLLAAYLKGQWPESESLSWLCLWSMWIEVLLVIMRFLRTQIKNFRIWSDWKYSGLLPLVVLALSRLEKALWWLLSHLPRYSFCGICGNELEGLALKITWGQKSLFPRWPTLYHLFCYTGVVTLRGTSRWLFIPLWLTISTAVRTVLGNVHGHMERVPSSPSLGNIPEDYSAPPRVASEEKGKSNQRSW